MLADTKQNVSLNSATIYIFKMLFISQLIAKNKIKNLYFVASITKYANAPKTPARIGKILLHEVKVNTPNPICKVKKKNNQNMLFAHLCLPR